jgi:hypothetical protein
MMVIAMNQVGLSISSWKSCAPSTHRYRRFSLLSFSFYNVMWAWREKLTIVRTNSVARRGPFPPLRPHATIILQVRF